MVNLLKLMKLYISISGGVETEKYGIEMQQKSQNLFFSLLHDC